MNKKELDKMKYEIAEELGLLDKVKKYGWKSLTSKESGKIGGLISRESKEKGDTDHIYTEFVEK